MLSEAKHLSFLDVTESGNDQRLKTWLQLEEFRGALQVNDINP